MFKKRNVYVVSWMTLGVDHYFKMRGWNVFRDEHMEDLQNIPDLICFTGGSDINPQYYGENKHVLTHYSDRRDKFEFGVFDKYCDKVPMVGICRGGQLLNIANGGKMYQHVTGHAGRTHAHTDYKGRTVQVSSAHHQMMIPPEDKGVVIGWAHHVPGVIENADGSIVDPRPEVDPETIWFADRKHLAFQPHPEFGPQSCTDYFFNLLEETVMK